MKKLAMALMILTTASACDKVSRKIDLDLERSDRVYQTAMSDYSAGRLEKAAEGFEKVLRTNPANTSARFQLACLQQDKMKDYLAAICNYTEYILQCPSTDKTKLAKDRMAICKTMLAQELVKDMRLEDSVTLANENEKLKAEVSKKADAMDKLEKELAAVKKELAVAKNESDNLRKMVGKIGESDEGTQPTKLPDDRDLLDEEDSNVEDRIRFSADVKNLILDEESETAATPFKVAEKKEKKEKAQIPEPLHEPRPDTYVVKEGDTLYKLAMRFYGVRSAWVKIRDANKAVISTDGRVKTGQTIRLPE